ncbi:MAG: hypothetical protein GY898_11315 [Proteobacteria bacterium]|nr:hypothetical protein [Pseudomonadota bacterium]
MKKSLLWGLGLALLVPSVALAGPKFSSSSSKSTAKEDYGPDKAFDGLLNTSWGEDAPGLGVEQWLEVDLGEDVTVKTLSIWGGNFDGREAWNGRSRVAEATITGWDGKGNEVFTKGVTLGDRFARKDTSLGETFRKLRVTIDEVHEGAIYADTHIAEIAFDLKEKPDPMWAAAIEKDIGRSSRTRDLPQQGEDLLQDAYDGCRDEEDYSKNFKFIGAHAAHGPEYRVAYVHKYVPVGHRLKLLQFNEDAVDLLGRLKDANAIKWLEIGAAGAIKATDREWLLESVGFFKAYQDLRRTPRSTVPNWGSEGMEKGAFMNRGEPIAISVDSLGNIWTADTGNNRVQRLTAAGTVDKVIGAPERGIAEEWFGDRGAPYATGSEAGTEAGQFTQPVHITVGNYDTVMVVDASMRVQVFDGEGTFKKEWQVDTPWRPNPGTGNGTPILTWLDDDFYLIVKDEVFIYDAEGTQKNRYTLEGGPVQAGVIAAGGKLLVRHVGSRELTEYKPEDGFRQGNWLRKGVPDDGSEDWDLATDEKDNVYVVTDAGNVFKWNKRGKFVTKIEAFENARDMPRIAVYDTIIYISARNEIHRIAQED